jgi:hypothetical protein
MEYYKIETGRIEGNTIKGYENVYGEIVKVKIDYEDCSEQTSVYIITSEGEKISYPDNNQNILEYPRHPINAGKFQSLDPDAGGEERYINCGQLFIQIEDSEIGEKIGTIKNITIVLKR